MPKLACIGEERSPLEMMSEVLRKLAEAEGSCGEAADAAGWVHRLLTSRGVLLSVLALDGDSDSMRLALLPRGLNHCVAGG